MIMKNFALLNHSKQNKTLDFNNYNQTPFLGKAKNNEEKNLILRATDFIIDNASKISLAASLPNTIGGAAILASCAMNGASYFIPQEQPYVPNIPQKEPTCILNTVKQAEAAEINEIKGFFNPENYEINNNQPVQQAPIIHASLKSSLQNLSKSFSHFGFRALGASGLINSVPGILVQIKTKEPSAIASSIIGAYGTYAMATMGNDPLTSFLKRSVGIQFDDPQLVPILVGMVSGTIGAFGYANILEKNFGDKKTDDGNKPIEEKAEEWLKEANKEKEKIGHPLKSTLLDFVNKANTVPNQKRIIGFLTAYNGSLVAILSINKGTPYKEILESLKNIGLTAKAGMETISSLSVANKMDKGIPRDCIIATTLTGCLPQVLGPQSRIAMGLGGLGSLPGTIGYLATLSSNNKVDKTDEPLKNNVDKIEILNDDDFSLFFEGLTASKAPDIKTIAKKKVNIKTLDIIKLSSKELNYTLNTFGGTALNAINKNGTPVSLRNHLAGLPVEDVEQILKSISEKFRNIPSNKIFEAYNDLKSSPTKAALEACNASDVDLASFIKETLDKPLGKNACSMRDLALEENEDSRAIDQKLNENDFYFCANLLNLTNDYIKEKIVKEAVNEYKKK